jgi:Carboxypeptidase regulatory-like domain/TonB-dependent Receptor Plug Domain
LFNFKINLLNKINILPLQKKFMKKIIFAFLISTFYVHAQKTGNISGFVYDEFGKPLSGVSVSASNSQFETKSNDNGFFVFENLETKTYNFTATFTGFETETVFNINIKSVANTNLIFNLKPQSKQLDEVLITKNPFKRKKETPISIQSLSAVEISTYPGGNNDIAKVVQSLPGVSGAIGFRNDVIIRGGAPNENVYYLDGIEIPNINHFSTQGSAGGPVGLLNVSFIEGVTLATSSFESKYDNVLSGVLQFNQRKGNTKKFQGNVRVGASEAAATLEGPMFKGNKENSNTSYIVSIRRSYLQFLFELIGLPIRPDYWDYQYKFNHKIDEYNDINFLGIGSIDDFSVKRPKDFTLQQQLFLEQVSIIKQLTTTSGLTWKKRFKDGSGFMLNSVSANVLNNNFKRYKDNENLTGLFFNNNSKETEIKYRNEITKNIQDWKITTGFNITNSIYKNETQIINQNLEYKTDLNFFKFGIFIQTSKSFLNERLDFSFGLRSDKNTFTNEKNQLINTLSPRLSLSYALNQNKDWRLNATVGKYFKIQPYTVLGYKDNSQTLVNQNANYTNNIHFVLGISKSINKTTQASIEGFYKKYNNYAVSLLDGVSLANKGAGFVVIGNEQVITNGVGNTYGVEFTYQQKLTNNFFGIFAYTLFKSEFTGLDQKYRPSVWDSRQLISFTGGYKFKKNLEIGLKYRFAGKTPFVPVNQTATLNEYPNIILDYQKLGDENLAPFSQVDFRIDKKWNFKKIALDVFLDVQNLFQQQIPEPPRFGLNRNETTGDIILPRSLVQVPPTASSSVPTLGIILDF